tara:strand:- start:1318 stop:1755 length:438 start_codon:yes stop_codon:yes gene_type:complete
MLVLMLVMLVISLLELLFLLLLAFSEILSALLGLVRWGTLSSDLAIHSLLFASFYDVQSKKNRSYSAAGVISFSTQALYLSEVEIEYKLALFFNQTKNAKRFCIFLNIARNDDTIQYQPFPCLRRTKHRRNFASGVTSTVYYYSM